MAASSAEESERKKGETDDDDHDLLENAAVAETKVADGEGVIEEEERKPERNGEHHHVGDASEPIDGPEEEAHGDTEIVNQAEAGEKDGVQARSAKDDGDQKGDGTTSSAAAAGGFDQDDFAEGSAQPSTAATDASPNDEGGYSTAAAAIAGREGKSNVEPEGAGDYGERKQDNGLVEDVVEAAAAAAAYNKPPSQDKNNLEQPGTSSEGKQDEGGTNTPAGAAQGPQAPEWPAYCNPAYRMPAELDVRVLIDGEVKSIPVKVERSDEQKLFQGGYWHKGNGKVCVRAYLVIICYLFHCCCLGQLSGQVVTNEGRPFSMGAVLVLPDVSPPLHTYFRSMRTRGRCLYRKLDRVQHSRETARLFSSLV